MDTLKLRPNRRHPEPGFPCPSCHAVLRDVKDSLLCTNSVCKYFNRLFDKPVMGRGIAVAKLKKIE